MFTPSTNSCVYLPFFFLVSFSDSTSASEQIENFLVMDFPYFFTSSDSVSIWISSFLSFGAITTPSMICTLFVLFLRINICYPSFQKIYFFLTRRKVLRSFANFKKELSYASSYNSIISKKNVFCKFLYHQKTKNYIITFWSKM